MKIKRIKKSHSQHHDQSDCGVACLQTIFKYYESNCSLDKFVLDLSNKLKFKLTIIFISHRLNYIPKITDEIFGMN
jgi:ATP-binding cassette, subfamily C, bacteriocin exporter